MIEDAANRARLSKLMQFHSTETDELTTLTDYVERMKKSQDEIYYLAGQDKEELLKSPLLERFKKRGVEVLIMTDPIDEYVTQVRVVSLVFVFGSFVRLAWPQYFDGRD